jgi:hypothetical protein
MPLAIPFQSWPLSMNSKLRALQKTAQGADKEKQTSSKIKSK